MKPALFDLILAIGIAFYLCVLYIFVEVSGSVLTFVLITYNKLHFLMRLDLKQKNFTFFSVFIVVITFNSLSFEYLIFHLIALII